MRIARRRTGVLGRE